MSKRWIINYLLFFLIILFSWIGNQSDPIKVDLSILQAQAKSIKNIKIETAKYTFEFEKTGTRWQFTAPFKWPASNINLDRISSIVNLQSISNLPSSKIDLSTLGLRFPKIIVSLNEDTIAFGDANQIGSKRYIMVNDTVHLVLDNHYPMLNSTISTFMDKSLIPQSFQLKRLELPEFTLNRESNSSWSTDKPFKEFSADLSNQLIQNWQSLEATQIRPYDKKRYPLKKINAITETKTIEYFLMSIKPEIILARADLDLQYHFDDDHYYDLFSLINQKRPLPIAKP